MKTMKTNINEVSSDIATKLVENQIGELATWVNTLDGPECFTEQAQDLFNETYDIVRNALEQHANQ